MDDYEVVVEKSKQPSRKFENFHAGFARLQSGPYFLDLLICLMCYTVILAHAILGDYRHLPLETWVCLCISSFSTIIIATRWDLKRASHISIVGNVMMIATSCIGVLSAGFGVAHGMDNDRWALAALDTNFNLLIAACFFFKMYFFDRYWRADIQKAIEEGFENSAIVESKMCYDAAAPLNFLLGLRRLFRFPFCMEPLTFILYLLMGVVNTVVCYRPLLISRWMFVTISCLPTLAIMKCWDLRNADEISSNAIIFWNLATTTIGATRAFSIFMHATQVADLTCLLVNIPQLVIVIANLYKLFTLDLAWIADLNDYRNVKGTVLPK